MVTLNKARFPCKMLYGYIYKKKIGGEAKIVELVRIDTCYYKLFSQNSQNSRKYKHTNQGLIVLFQNRRMTLFPT